MSTIMELLFALRWYLALQFVGLAALPLTLQFFRRMPGRGYPFTRPLGLMVAGWAFWLFSVFGWLPNTAGAAVAVLALLAAAGLVLVLRPSSDNPPPAPLPTRLVLTVEVLFAVAFALWSLVRAYMPRIETAGGEKWMEIALLNAVLRSPRFPPHDPWLSGYAISYYYFGYVIMGMLARLAAVPPTIAFNLGIATLFALTATGAYGLVYALLARRGESAARWGALWGPLIVAVVSNLQGVLEVFHARGLFPAAFWKWLDIRSINVPPPFAEGSWVPTRFMWWWQASRVLHDYAPWHTPANPAEWEVIDEFPAFSFILGDMHPHLLSLPFVLLALALALNLFFSPQRTQRTWKSLLLPAICLGGLGFLNTWDLPVYFALFVVALFLARSLGRQKDTSPLPILPPASRFLPLASCLLPPASRFLPLASCLLLASCFLLYLPFWLSLRSQVAGILPNLFNPTRLPQFLVMFGPLLFPVSVWVADRARKGKVRLSTVAFWGLALIIGLTAVLLVAILLNPEGRTYLAAWRSGGPIPGLEHIPDAGRLIGQRLLARFLTPWTSLLLVLLLVAALATALSVRRRSDSSEAEPEDLYLIVLAAAGAALPLAVEFIYLRDHFGTRMNTVFKFYFQAWTMWGIVAACAMALFWRGGPRWAAVVGTVIVLAGMVYPALAIPARAREYGGPPTLDGAAHLRSHYAAEMAAIDWLNAHVEGTPVILEAPGDRFRAYVYDGRVSAFTGLPALLGWGGHEHQWRGNYNEPARREPDIETLYTTTDISQTLTLLEQYDIIYIYTGLLERSRYPPDGLVKFARIANVVYDAEGVTIYRVP